MFWSFKEISISSNGDHLYYMRLVMWDIFLKE